MCFIGQVNREIKIYIHQFVHWNSYIAFYRASFNNVMDAVTFIET